MATPVFNTLSLHDALPICHGIANALDLRGVPVQGDVQPEGLLPEPEHLVARLRHRSEEHTSELQSQFHLVCRLLLEKKKKPNTLSYDQPIAYCTALINILL